MISKIIYTIWLNHNPEYPPIVKKCIESQKIEGYEHKVITLENCYKGSQYVNTALEMAKKTGHTKYFVKASDWLRMYHIHETGGIFLDADMEILPGKNFDDMLDNRMFTSNEVYGLAANCGFGSEKGHPFIKKYIDWIEANYRGDGDMVFEPGIRAFSDLMWITNKEEQGIKFYGTDVFHPYKHGTEEVNVTENTRVYHHFINSWCGKISKI